MTVTAVAAIQSEAVFVFICPLFSTIHISTITITITITITSTIHMRSSCFEYFWWHQRDNGVGGQCSAGGGVHGGSITIERSEGRG